MVVPGISRIAFSNPPANPSPWNRPKKNAAPSRLQPLARLGHNTFCSATNTMLPAISGSTIRSLT